MVSICVSSVCSAFDDETIGSKVVHERKLAFLDLLEREVQRSTFNMLGHCVVDLPTVANDMVGCGYGPASPHPSDYVMRSHRRHVSAYLRRDLAFPTKNVSAVVYTKAAALADPDIDAQEYERISRSTASHVLVAVLASDGRKATLSPYRFVMNLAGGNRSALAWTADEIRAVAREIAANEQTSVVAD